jgi:hypothetical protein
VRTGPNLAEAGLASVSPSHKLAQVFLGHNDEETAAVHDFEAEADKLAVRWGFNPCQGDVIERRGNLETGNE